MPWPRYLPDGSLDETFGTEGVALTPVGTGNDFGIALAQQGDSSIVLAGASVNNSYDFAAVRYTNGVATSVVEPPQKEDGYRLFEAFPNPFQHQTTIWFELPHPAYVTLRVYDFAGKEVTILADEQLPAGKHERIFDAGHLKSGVYGYLLKADSVELHGRVVLVR